MITRWDIFLEFGFYSMRFNGGMFLNGEFLPNGRPCPVRVLFFWRPPCICSHVPIKGGGGSYIPNRDAPWPSCFPCEGLLHLGALPPVIFLIRSTANGIPMEARIVSTPHMLMQEFCQPACYFLAAVYYEPFCLILMQNPSVRYLQ